MMDEQLDKMNLMHDEAPNQDQMRPEEEHNLIGM